MPDKEIINLLSTQKEIANLCYFCYYHEKSGVYEVNISVEGFTKKIKTKNKNVCLGLIVDILFELKEKIKWQKRKESQASQPSKQNYKKHGRY